MALTKDDLAGFTGTEHWHRHGLVRSVVYTDGVQFLAEKAGAYWLIDKIATLQLGQPLRGEEFQCWKLAVTDGAATLTCDDGNGNALHAEQIEWTDFPLDEVALFVETSGQHTVILLPNEH